MNLKKKIICINLLRPPLPPDDRRLLTAFCKGLLRLAISGVRVGKLSRPPTPITNEVILNVESCISPEYAGRIVEDGVEFTIAHMNFSCSRCTDVSLDVP